MIIYKYLNQKGALATVENNSVLLKSPLDYNDPYDSLYYSSDDDNKKGFKLFMNYMLFKEIYDALTKGKKIIRASILSNEQKEKLLSVGKDIKESKEFKPIPFLQPYISFVYRWLSKTEKNLKDEYNSVILKAYKKVRKNTLASCFASSNDSILMWAHYAQDYKGACVEFEIDEDDVFRKVNYKEAPPSFDVEKVLGIVLGHKFLNIDIDVTNKKYLFFLDPLFTKAKEWEYEGEVRCIFSKKKEQDGLYQNKDKDYLFKMPAIKNIYVGYKADDKFIKDIRKLAKPNKIPVKKMEIQKDRYKLYF